jgi:hypothetical protein
MPGETKKTKKNTSDKKNKKEAKVSAPKDKRRNMSDKVKAFRIGGGNIIKKNKAPIASGVASFALGALSGALVNDALVSKNKSKQMVPVDSVYGKSVEFSEGFKSCREESSKEISNLRSKNEDFTKVINDKDREIANLTSIITNLRLENDKLRNCSDELRNTLKEIDIYKKLLLASEASKNSTRM